MGLEKYRILTWEIFTISNQTIAVSFNHDHYITQTVCLFIVAMLVKTL